MRARESPHEPVNLSPGALWIVECRSDLPYVRVEVVGEPQKPATFRRQMPEVGVPSWVRRYAAVRIEKTGRPTMPHSIWALVLMPTAPAEWYIESKKSLRDAASTNWHRRVATPKRSGDPSRRSDATADDSRDAAAVRMPAVPTRTSGADRIAPIHCSMKTTSSGAMNGDEQR